MEHIIEAKEIKPETIKKIFALADSFERRHSTPLKGKIMAALFFEPSTRTRFSFESAMLRLGGSVISSDNARELMSTTKGETIEDTMRMISNYADVAVIRHYEVGAVKRASSVATIPVINAGDGPGEHPTQALLDLYTMKRELGKIDGLHIAFMGDLKNGRTVRSLSYLLGNYKDVKVSLVSPSGLKVGDDIKEYLAAHGVSYEEMEKIDPIIGAIDVLYQTRIQKERFVSEEEYLKYKGVYVISRKDADAMKDGAIIMHPFPRVDEIDPDVDSSPHAAYFKQPRYGVLVRMALLAYLLK